ncbi:nucleotidyltransferase family protein [Vreelandella zhaodongensis]|uniref:nucleotidyltransferase family protein n=1 Tax=Vreelandella zhaodongensis TaxID=1176240 RepID=UPI003EBCB0A9
MVHLIVAYNILEVSTVTGQDQEVIIVAPFGVKPLFDYTITLNPKRPKRTDFEARVYSKRWLQTWPKLVVNA